MILFKDDIFYILALSLSSFSDFQSLAGAEPKILLSSVCGHGVAEGEDVVTDVVNAYLQQLLAGGASERVVQQGIGQVVHHIMTKNLRPISESSASTRCWSNKCELSLCNRVEVWHLFPG